VLSNFRRQSSETLGWPESFRASRAGGNENKPTSLQPGLFEIVLQPYVNSSLVSDPAAVIIRRAPALGVADHEDRTKLSLVDFFDLAQFQ